MRAGAMLSAKARGVTRTVQRLVAQQRVVEADRVADPEVVGEGESRANLPPRTTSTGFSTFRYWRGDVPGLEPGLVDQDHEGGGAAVEDRDLGPVHLDERVVDSQRVERGQQVLDGVDGDPVAGERRGVVLAPR